MAEQQPRTVTIVGGGTAGWLTAITLVTFINRAREKPAIRVELIESPNVPTIGVGEATVPGMVRLLMQLRIDEGEFLRRTNASFKCGVRFVDWNRKADGTSRTFLHPFQKGPYLDSYPGAYHFQAFAPPGASFADSLVPNGAVVEGGFGPREAASKPFEGTVAYAYHLDAGLFADYLRELSVGRGVTHLRDDVAKVELAESGEVAALHLAGRGRHPVQFVVDCTGFKGLVISEALGAEFESWSHLLPCDRALAVQLPHKDPRKIDPCTTSTALGGGWVWNVPLHSRVGTGYVYSSAFRSEDEAAAEFRAHLGAWADGADFRALSMRVGRLKQSWVKNCVAIGLSSGFVEPLESTSIYMIEMGVRWLVESLPDGAVQPAVVRRYNRWMDELYAEVRDFIMMHYHLANRDDSPFWHAVRSQIALPDSLQENLETWRHALPGPVDTAANRLFQFWNYLYVLFGKGYFDGVQLAACRSVKPADWDAWQQNLERSKLLLRQHLPSHRTLLDHARGEVSPAIDPARRPALRTMPMASAGGGIAGPTPAAMPAGPPLRSSGFVTLGAPGLRRAR